MGGAPPALPTIIVMDYSGEPGVGLDVITNDANGLLVAMGVTGSDGTVALPIPDGGSASLLYSYDFEGATNRFIETVHFAGAAPATVQLNSFMPQHFSESGSMTIDVTWAQKAGATMYNASGTCFGTSTSELSVSFPSEASCAPTQRYDVLVWAVDDEGNVVDYGHVDDAIFSDGGAAQHTIVWNNEPAAVVELQALNVPADATAVQMVAQSYETEAWFASGLSDGAYVNDPADEVSAALQQLPSYGSMQCQSISVVMPDSGTAAANIAKSRCAIPADLSPLVFDVARLARYELSVLDAAPLSLQWAESWPGEAGDAVIASQPWYNESSVTTWNNYVAPGAGQVPFVELPAYLDVYGFQEGDSFGLRGVSHTDHLELDGFDALLADGGFPHFFNPNAEVESNWAGTYP